MTTTFLFENTLPSFECTFKFKVTFLMLHQPTTRHRASLLAVFLIATIVVMNASLVLRDHDARQGMAQQARASSLSGPRVINHNCTNYNRIPTGYLDIIKSMNFNVHFAHTSHGGQLTEGLNQIISVNGTFNFTVGSSDVTPSGDSLDIFEGQRNATFSETYITPDLYWETNQGIDLTRYVLNNYPINVSIWSFCTQLDYNDAA
jgi:hypothetical protein